MEIKQVDIREKYYNDIHNMKPKWWMRWGFLSVFVVLFITLSLGYIVKYPDVIRSEFRLTTNKPSVTLPLGVGAQIEHIFVKDKDSVTPNTTLLIIKNNSNYRDVFLLKKAINNFSFEKDSIIQFFDHFLNYDLQLGDVIENDWITFSSELLDYYKIVKLDSYQSQVDFLKNELRRQYQLKRQYIQLKNTDGQQKLLLDKKIKTDSILFSKGVISKMELNTNKRSFFSNSKILQQNNLALKRINLDITRLENSIKKTY
jgi:multidrug efflux pump subunit AcrA (membrane-fusion protein)